MVLTDSFHGTVFSCIFEKPFYVLNRQLLEHEKSMNSRLTTLFNLLKIENTRMIEDIFLIDEYDFKDEELIKIKESKKQCKIRGINYLKEAIEKVRNEQTK